MAEVGGKDIFSEPLFALITGASQGLGRSIAIGLASVVSGGSRIAISARNGDGLEQTEVLAAKERQTSGLGNDIVYVRVAADLNDFEDVEKLVALCVQGRHSSEFPSALIVHNVGSVGDTSKEMCDFLDPKEVNDYFRLNLAHLSPITGRFIKWRGNQQHDFKTVIVNISSLLALQPGQCFSLYAAGKAARDMLFRVLAVENPAIKVLNWAPGPLITAMALKIWNTPNKHDTDKLCLKMKHEGKYLTCEESTSKFLQVLRNDQYKSGDHVDYFD